MERTNRQSISKPVLDSRVVFLSLVFFELAILYYFLLKAGVLTHDEINAIIECQKGTYLDTSIHNYLAHPRGLFILDVFVQYPQFSIMNEAIYRLFDIAGISFAVAFFHLFLCRLLGKNAARGITLSFLLFAAFSSTDHNGFIAFGWSYKLRIGYAFLSLYLLLLYFDTQKKKFLAFSAITYIFVSALYEAYVFLCVPIALLTIFKMRQAAGAIHPRKLIAIAAVFALPEIAYLLIYIAMANTSTVEYGGTTIDASFSFAERLRSLFAYTVGELPTIREEVTFTECLRELKHAYPVVIFLFAENIVVASMATRYFYLASSDRSVHALFPGIVLLVTAFAICIPYGLATQYVDWIINGNGATKGYGVSYYCLFFLVAAFGCFALSVMKLASKAKPLFALCALTVFSGLLMIGFHSDLNNRAYARALDINDNKYEMFFKAVQSPHFRDIENGATIYAPQMIGVYEQISSLDSYAEAINGQTLTFANTAEQAPDCSHLLSYDVLTYSMVLAEINDDGTLNKPAVIVFEPDSITHIDFTSHGRDYSLSSSDIETGTASYLVHFEDTPYNRMIVFDTDNVSNLIFNGGNYSRSGEKHHVTILN